MGTSATNGRWFVQAVSVITPQSATMSGIFNRFELFRSMAKFVSWGGVEPEQIFRDESYDPARTVGMRRRTRSRPIIYHLESTSTLKRVSRTPRIIGKF